MPNIIITGAQLYNKGSEAMIYTVTSELKNKYPDHHILLLTNIEHDEKDVREFPYELITLSFYDRLVLYFHLTPLYELMYRVTKKRSIRKRMDKLRRAFLEADQLYDISGFGLSNQFTLRHQGSYLLNLLLAKKYNVRAALLPQSFGPFTYSKTLKPFMHYLLRKALSYPEKVFARESESRQHISAFRPEDVTPAMDLVLTNKAPEAKHEVNRHAVALVPNKKLLNYQPKEEIIAYFSNIIGFLESKQENISLLYHSREDKELCEEILESLSDQSRAEKIPVVEVTSENAEEELHNKKFIVASRYHSIIHAYRSSTPALVIGWAAKYKELLEYFNQERYHVDISSLQADKVMQQLDVLYNQWEQESASIKQTLKTLDKQEYLL